MKENSEQNRKGGEAIGRRSRIKTKWKPEEKGEKMRHRRKRCLKECIDNMAASKFRSGTKGERNWFGEKKKNTILSLNCVLSCKTFHQAFWKDNPTPTPPFQCLSKDMLFFFTAQVTEMCFSCLSECLRLLQRPHSYSCHCCNVQIFWNASEWDLTS